MQRAGRFQTMPHYEPIFHIVLYQPEIPHNTGAVGRTCVALGAKLWLVRPLGFRITNRHLKRAGLDYWPFLEWEVVNHWQGLEEALAEHRFWFFTKTAAQCYTSATFQKGDVLVFGSEPQGLPSSLLAAHRDACLRIPIRGAVRSLNLSVSVGVAAYEAARQIGWPGIPVSAPLNHVKEVNPPV